MLFWQNILNSRQITAGIEEKLANQGEVLLGGISRIYLPYQTNGNHAINSRPRNLRTAQEMCIRFQGNCKQTTG